MFDWSCGVLFCRVYDSAEVRRYAVTAEIVPDYWAMQTIEIRAFLQVTDPVIFTSPTMLTL